MFVIFKIIIILFWILFLLPFQVTFIIVKSNARYNLPRIFHKGLLIILGVKLNIRGSILKKRPLILLGNHCSYLDIIVLSSLTSVCFVAKEEIKSWFFFGFLAKLQNTIFISRRNFSTINSIHKINKKLNRSFAIILFPEATTSKGKTILKFKSSLYGIFEKNSIIKLQNFSLCYTHINGMPLDNRLRPKIAWYGDMKLLSHLKRLLNISSINASVTFHPSLNILGLDRKEICYESREQVLNGFHSSF